ncbi:MAG TPA: DUF4388 domain-containing protein, partial [Myxococcus sp.]|nr:DUF4388 domain-containing protein [Myxococcus sp.]
MAEGEVRQYWVRNDKGTMWGPLTLVTIELLIESGSIKGKLQVSEDGLNFAFPWRFPEVLEVFPPALWGPGAPAAPAAPAAGAIALGPDVGAAPGAGTPGAAAPQAPMAGPGARPMAGPGTRPMAGPGAAPMAGPGAAPTAGPGATLMAGPGARANADPARRPVGPPQVAARPGVPPGAAPRPPPTVGAAPGVAPGRPPGVPGPPVSAVPPAVPPAASPTPPPVVPPPRPAPAPAPVASAAPPVTDADSRTVPPQGQLEQYSPIRLYGLLAAGEHTGLLTLTLSDRSVQVHFRKGNPEFVDSSHPEDALGTSLVGARLLTPEQLQQAEPTARERFGGDLLGALFGQGLLQPATAFTVLAQRAASILSKGLRAESGTFTYEPRELPPSKAMPLGNRWAVLSDTVRRIPPMDLKRRLAPVLPLPIMKSGGLVAASELRLTPHEVRTLTVIDGVRSVGQLLTDLPQDADHLLRLAFLLKELDGVSFAGSARLAAPPPPAAEGRPPPPQAVPPP